MIRARCNARLTAGWLKSSRLAAAVMLFSSAIAANVIRRFKSTCRNFSKRMTAMTIMHEPHEVGDSSLTVSFRWSYLSSLALHVVECTLYLAFESHSLRHIFNRLESNPAE